MKVTIKAAQNNFFDRKIIVDAVSKARIRVLSKMGAFVRRTARSSIRKRKKPSPPGKPPSSHVGLLKQFLFFSYDRSTESVVVGPALITRPSGAPETLEYGGRATIERQRFVSGPKYGNRVRRVKEKHKVRISKRPFMRPALKAELPNFAGLWANSIR